MTNGKVSVTATSQTFGPAATVIPKFIIINRGTTRVFINGDGEDAVDDEGFNLDPGETVTDDILMPVYRQGQLSAVCTAGETGTLYFSFQ